MTAPADIGESYGAAILLLRWWVHRWSQRKLAAKAGVSAASLSSYERRKTVPSLENRRKVAGALGVSLADLDRLAAAIQTATLGLLDPSTGGIELTALQVTAALSDDFHRGALPLVMQFLSSLRSEPPANSEEEIQALAPVLRRISARGLQALLETSPSLHRRSFVKVVGEESARAAADDANRALELASLALWVAERIAGEEGWQSRISAWAFLGNARRVRSDLDGGEQAFAVSTQLRQEEGHGPIREAWRLFDLEASLRIDLRQHSEALHLLAQASQEAPQAGAVQARLLSQIAHVHEAMDDSESALRMFQQAASLVDREADEPRLVWMVQSNLMGSLCEVGRASEAAPMLPELRVLAAQVGHGLCRIRLRWIEAKIAAGLGQLDEAVEGLSFVRSAFAKETIRYDEALASMELAELYLQQGRTTDVKRLVLEMEPVFRDKRVHQEAQKALGLFRRAVEMETVTAEMVRRVAVYLRRAQNDPRLQFETS